MVERRRQIVKVRTRMPAARVALAMSIAMLLLLVAGSSPAGAARSHPFGYSFAAGAGCTTPKDVAVDEANGWVYVYCANTHALNGGGTGMIKRYDLLGNPVNFEHNEPYERNDGVIINYVSGNTLTHVPDPGNVAFGVCPCFSGEGVFGIMSMDVDNSSSGHPGFIYVTPNGGSRNLDIFEPSGRWAGAIPTSSNAGAPLTVGVDDQGFLYSGTNGNNGRGKIEKFNLAYKEVEQIFFDNTWNHVRPDSTHGVWAAQNAGGINGQGIFRFEADAFNTRLKTDGVGQTEYAIPSKFSPYAPAPLFPATGGADAHRFDVDPDNDDLYLDRVTSIETYSKGTPTEQAHKIQPSFGAGQLTGSRGIHVTKSDHIFASRTTGGGQIAVFLPGEIIPKATTNAAKLTDIEHTSVTVTGVVDPDGGSPITSCKVEYGLSTTYGSTAPCVPDPNAAPPGSNFSGPTEVSAVISGGTGAALHYRFTATNASGEGWGVNRAAAPAAVLDVKTDPATEVDMDSATFHGSFNPDSISTTYKFQYGLNTEYRQETPAQGPVSGASSQPASAAVAGLQSGRTYHFRLIAINADGVTFGEDQEITTPSPPGVSGVHATEVTETSAVLKATVDPVGYATEYHLEYGTTPDYGTTVPDPDGKLPATNEPQKITVPIAGLQPNVTHHFRIVASNQWGDTVGDDTTFDFAPPSCPNAHVRQQTGANYLPDCRAYELVSPENAGSAVLFPSDELLVFGTGFGGVGAQYYFANWIQNTGLATSPSRFQFYGGLGAVPGLDPPNSLLDAYLATRTSTGWKTTLPGLKGSETLTAARRQCSLDMSLCLSFRGPDQTGILKDLQENAPNVFNASGKRIGQWPTNVNTIPGGVRFSGDTQPSGDFSHFAFSSRNILFVAGGVIGPPGSAYDNDIESQSIEIISKLPSGADIPQDPAGGGGATEFITFSPRGVARDGSHILMRTKAAGGGHHLYVRVNGAVTYDIARGAGAKVVGSTLDGTKVVYTTTEQLLPGDTDIGSDVYLWSAAGDTLTILSQGNGEGDSDACSTSFTAQCGALAMTTERGTRGGFTSPLPGGTAENVIINAPGIDSTIARESGDVLFYSPEDLDPAGAAAPNERNLYLTRNGSPQFVATLDPGTQINRLQLSDDGSHAAFVTAARLTGYDNMGFKVMYTYDADTGLIRCASCDPTGSPPTANVTASEGGPFMSDDGRAFFATLDSLVPQDTDAITSVYEFVDGRPQLISTGTSSRDFSGAGITTLFFVPLHIGLESVSHDGVDVIFSTYDELVPQDENGQALKFYDARSGGGFDVDAEPAPCVAADECHGVDSTRPATRELPSNAGLGAGSNFTAKKTRRCKKGQKRRQGRCVKRDRQRRAKNASTGVNRG